MQTIAVVDSYDTSHEGAAAIDIQGVVVIDFVNSFPGAKLTTVFTPFFPEISNNAQLMLGEIFIKLIGSIMEYVAFVR